MQVQVIYLTPKVAQQMLASNTNNRPISEKKIAEYTNYMLKGLWRENGESVSITKNGSLVNGQHRLHATIRANVSWNLTVVSGIADDVVNTLDNVRSRSAGDILHSLGVCEHSTLSGAIARAACLYVAGGTPNQSANRLQVTAFATAHPYVSEAAALAVKNNSKGFPRAPLGAVLFLGNECQNYDAEARSFMDGLTSGTNLKRGDPRLALREWELNERRRVRNRISPMAAFGAAARAWNAYASGRSLTIIKGINVANHESLNIFGFAPELYSHDERTWKMQTSE